jgi:prepilin-type N-terminal cleavage/methylation domain-containing protein/prepilin-type processing-associated H-X9-DG protein
MHKRRGFTLIELLVVIAIIALLMAILMPALARVRKQAEAVACMANLKQWGLSFAMYCGENEGRFCSRDGSNDWFETYEKYYQNHDLRLCPSATLPYLEGGRNPFCAFGESPDDKGSYCINLWTSDEEGPEDNFQAFWRTPDVKGGDTIPVFGDSNWGNADPLHKDDPPEFEGDLYEPNANEMKRFCIDRHGNGIMQMLFMDWSVQKVGLKQLWELDWHRDWNPRNDPPPDWPEWMKSFKEYYNY